MKNLIIILDSGFVHQIQCETATDAIIALATFSKEMIVNKVATKILSNRTVTVTNVNVKFTGMYDNKRFFWYH